jgi:hypothetical protein
MKLRRTLLNKTLFVLPGSVEPGEAMSGIIKTWPRVLLLLPFVFFCVPFVANAQQDPTQCFLVSGAGDAPADGLYVYGGSSVDTLAGDNSYGYWTNGVFDMLDTTNYIPVMWKISDLLTSMDWYRGGLAFDWTVWTWSQGFEIPPAPTVVHTSCPSSPPAVSITAPTNSSTVSGTTAITATASATAPASISSVIFYLDGSVLGSSSSTSSPSYSWNTATPNGSHTLTAVATDNYGNTATSSAVTVIVSNAVPTATPVATPVVNITSSTLTVVTTFSKAMSGSVTPAIAFTPDISADLTAGSASWTDSTHYSAAYTAASSVDVSAAATVSGAQDPDGNVAASASSATFIVDTLAPVITLNGASSIEFTVNSTFTDPGATATDVMDGTDSVTVTGTVNTAVVGTYTLTYTAVDAAGNQALPVTRTVTVEAAVLSPVSGGWSGGCSTYPQGELPSWGVIPCTPTNPNQGPAVLPGIATTQPSLQSQGLTLQIGGGITLSKNYQLWDKGEDIRTLQKFFNTHGFIIASSGPGSPGDETTFFGTKTYQALKKFQKANNLPATGYLGPLTRAALANTTTSTDATTSAATSTSQ